MFDINKCPKDKDGSVILCKSDYPFDLIGIQGKTVLTIKRVPPGPRARGWRGE